MNSLCSSSAFALCANSEPESVILQKKVGERKRKSRVQGPDLICEKSRKSSSVFSRRKSTLVKKIEELSVLCDVEACFVCFGKESETPSSSSSSSISNSISDSQQQYCWPSTQKVYQMMSAYRAMAMDKNKNKMRNRNAVDLCNFLPQKIDALNQQLCSLIDQNQQLQKQQEVQRMLCSSSALGSPQGLCQTLNAIDFKMGLIQHRIEHLKKTQSGMNNQICDPRYNTSQQQQCTDNLPTIFAQEFHGRSSLVNSSSSSNIPSLCNNDSGDLAVCSHLYQQPINDEPNYQWILEETQSGMNNQICDPRYNTFQQQCTDNPPTIFAREFHGRPSMVNCSSSSNIPNLCNDSGDLAVCSHLYQQPINDQPNYEWILNTLFDDDDDDHMEAGLFL